ncbi:hypothetical protein [Sorangium sp. So ce1024]|uniref:hypothetical protein n=1 Tax=Sorangium sp. So ce1024 TaxID=3133327 RepID=UPI003EFDB087
MTSGFTARPSSARRSAAASPREASRSASAPTPGARRAIPRFLDGSLRSFAEPASPARPALSVPSARGESRASSADGADARAAAPPAEQRPAEAAAPAGAEHEAEAGADAEASAGAAQAEEPGAGGGATGAEGTGGAAATGRAARAPGERGGGGGANGAPARAPEAGADPDTPEPPADGARALDEASAPPGIEPAAPARLGGVELPLIHQPPRQSEQTKKRIERSTRISPSEHHGRVRAHVMRLGQLLRRGLTEVVRTVESIASELRLHMERRADDVVVESEGYVAQLDAVFDGVKAQITTVADAHAEAVRTSGTGRHGDIGQARADARHQLYTTLESQSAAIRAAAAVVRVEHGRLVDEMARRLEAVGRTGADPGAAPAASGGEPSPIVAEGTRIVTVLQRSGDSNLVRYQNYRCAEHTPARAEEKQLSMESGARQRAASLRAPSEVEFWTQVMLGLADPVVARAGDTSASDRRASQEETIDEQALVRQARDAALAAIDGAKAAAHAQLDRQREQAVKSLRTAAHKARKALRAQGLLAENGMLTLAPSFADAWRDLAGKARALVPGGTFLDSRKIVPRLAALDRAARALEKQQIKAAQEQDEASRESAEEAIRQYLKGFADIVRGARDATGAALVSARMDFASSELAFTGQMSSGTEEAVRLAQEHADAAVARMERAPGGVERHGRDFVQSQVRRSYEAQVRQFAQFYRHNKSSLFDELDRGVFVEIRRAVEREISDRAQRLDDAMPETSTLGWIASGVLGGGVGLVVYAAVTDADESAVVSEISKVPKEGRAALKEHFDDTYGSLLARLDDRLSEDEEAICVELLRGTEEGDVRAAELALANEPSWWGIDTAARDAVLRGLDAGELSRLRQTHGRDQAVERMTAGLDPTDVSMEEDYLDHVRAARLAADVRTGFDRSRLQGNEASVAAIRQLEQDARSAMAGEYYAQFVTQRQVDRMLTEVYREHAAQEEVSEARARGETLSVADARASARRLDADQARDRFADWATRPIDQEVPVDEHGNVTTIRHELTPEASQAIRDVIRQDANAADAQERADRAWQSVAAFQIRTAEREGLSENRQAAVTRAVQNPALQRSQQEWTAARRELELAQAARPVDRARIDEAQWHLNQAFARYQSLRETHERRMSGLAGQLGARAEGADGAAARGPQAGSQAVGQRLGALFARADATHGEEYGRTLATQGRGDLYAGAMLASGGYGDGTNEELLELVTQGRSREEIAAANQRYQTDPSVSRVDWVTGERHGTFQERILAEVSGDLEMKMQEHLLGDPVTEADHVQLALMRYGHQRVQGTGFIAERTMRGTPELRAIDESRDALLGALRRDPALRDIDPLLGPDGMLSREAYAALDRRDRARMAERRHQAYLDATSKEPPRARDVTDDEMRRRASAGLPDDLSTLSFRLGLAADNYRAEIDRQEAAAMLGIQIVGAALTVALMLIPGVNVIAAGILAAVLTGVATVLVKEGLRGDRYGWEEMAQDIGMTAVEAATAWAGGQLASRAAGAAKVASAAARAAGATEAQIARRALQVSVRHALVRGAVTQGFSGLASRAMDDATWRDGFARGMQRTLQAGARGAIVGAVTEGISTRMGHGLQQRITGTNVQRAAGAVAEGTEAAAHAGAGAARGGAGAARAGAAGAGGAAGRPSLFRTGLGEGVASALSGTAGELAGAGFDRLTGEARTGGRELLLHLGKTFGRELLTGMARGAVQAHWARRYEDTRSRLLDRGGPVSDAERAQLQRYARSAGRDADDGPEGFLRFEADLGEARQRRAQLVGDLPEGLRPHVEALPISALEQVRGYVDQPPEGAARLAFLRGLRAHGVEDLPSFGRRLDAAAEQVAQRRAAAAAERKAVRRAVLAGLPAHLRGLVGELPAHQLAALPPAALRSVAEAAARGEPLAPRDRAELVRQARAARPDVDVKALLADVDAAISAGRAAHERFREGRRRFIEGLPAEARRAAAALPPEALQRMRRMAEAGDRGTAHQRELLVRALASAAPDADAAAMLRGLDAAVSRTRAAREAARIARLAERADALTDLPEALRGPLSALPDEGLAIVRQLQQEGRQPSPQLLAALSRMARAEAPEMDAGRFRRALAEAVEHPRRVAAADAQAQRALRRELLAGVPPEQRRLIADVPILRVSAAELAAHTGVSGADAAVVSVAGRPVVLFREGADPRLLAEQATRLLVARDPAWLSPARLLDESRLRNWPDMPVGERLATWRATISLEIESHQRLLAGYQAEATGASSPAARAELQARAEDTRRALGALRRRLAEVDGIDGVRRYAIAVGVMSPPDFLGAPPRRVTAGVPDAAASTPRPEVDAPRALASRLRQIEAEAARSLLVSGARIEQGVDAHGNLLVAPDGSPRGYGIRFGYQVRFHSDGVTEIRIPVHLEPGKNVSPADLARVRRNAQLGVDRYYAGRHRVPGPDGRPGLLRVELDFVDDPSAAQLRVKVKAGDGPAFQNQWYVEGDPTTHAHEITHQLGLVDEYVDHGPHGFKAAARATPASPGVFTDHGLMGNYWIPGSPVPTVDPRTHVPPRYIRRILADIQAARAAAAVAGPAPPAARAPDALAHERPAAPPRRVEDVDDPWQQLAELGEVMPKEVLDALRFDNDWNRIAREMADADWRGMGLSDPTQHVLDRLPSEMLDALRAGQARLIVHLGPVPKGVDAQAMRVAGGREPLNYPGRVVSRPRPDGVAEYHLYGITGETWLTQTVYMLAHARVRRSAVELAGTLDPRGYVRDQLDATLREHTFDSVVLGPAGRLREAAWTEIAQRALNQPHLEEHARRVIDIVDSLASSEARESASEGMARIAQEVRSRVDLLHRALRAMEAPTGLDDTHAQALQEAFRGLAGAAPDAAAVQRELARWTELAQALADPEARTTAIRLAQTFGELTRSRLNADLARALQVQTVIEAQASWTRLRGESGDARAFLDAVERQSWAAALPQVQRALESSRRPPRVPPVGSSLPGTSASIQELQRGGLRHVVITVDGRSHLIVDIGSAHGDLAYHAMAEVLARQPTIRTVGMYGTTGAIADPARKQGAPGVGAFVAPRVVHPQGQESTPISLENLFPWQWGEHGNVSTLLQQHRAAVSTLLEGRVTTIDMEAWHLTVAIMEHARRSGRTPEVGIALRVTDVVTSPEQGAQRRREETEAERGEVAAREREILRLLRILRQEEP